MPLIDITNPDVIKFLIESYDKTTRLRMKWNELNKNKLKHAATLQREEKGYFETDVLKSTMVAGMETVTRDFKSGTPNKRLVPIRDGTFIPTTKHMRKGHSIVDVGLGDPKQDPLLARPDTDLRIDPIMRPMDPKLRKIIYKDIPTFGRQEYMKRRYRMDPESKFYFPQSAAMEYGWRLRDSYFGMCPPKFGRVWRLARDIKNRSGPQPDPIYYGRPDVGGPDKCPS